MVVLFLAVVFGVFLVMTVVTFLLVGLTAFVAGIVRLVTPRRYRHRR